MSSGASAWYESESPTKSRWLATLMAAVGTGTALYAKVMSPLAASVTCEYFISIVQKSAKVDAPGWVNAAGSWGRVIGYSSNKIHRTWCINFSRSLYIDVLNKVVESF